MNTAAWYTSSFYTLYAQHKLKDMCLNMNAL